MRSGSTFLAEKGGSSDQMGVVSGGLLSDGFFFLFEWTTLLAVRWPLQLYRRSGERRVHSNQGLKGGKGWQLAQGRHRGHDLGLGSYREGRGSDCAPRCKDAPTSGRGGSSTSPARSVSV